MGAPSSPNTPVTTYQHKTPHAGIFTKTSAVTPHSALHCVFTNCIAVQHTVTQTEQGNVA